MVVKVRKYKRRDGTKVVSHTRSAVESDMKFKAGDSVKKKESKKKDSGLKEMAKKSPKGKFNVGDKVMLRDDVLQRHARSVPAHLGYTTEQFAWRDTLREKEGVVGVVKRVSDGYVNVVFPDNTTIGINESELVVPVDSIIVGSKTAYQLVKDVSAGYVKSFKDDVLVHDRKALRGYDGDFLYGMRESGTNVIKEGDLKSINMEGFEFSRTFFLGDNKRFFIKEGSSFKEVSKTRILNKLDEYKNKVAWLDDEKNHTLRNRFNGNFLSIDYSYRERKWYFTAQDKKYNTLERKTFDNYEDANKYMYDSIERYS